MDFKLKKSDLNFRVYTAPSPPDVAQENDIVLISDVPTTNWVLSPDAPSGIPQNDGDVWIQYSVVGRTFNALKNNTMRIAAISAKQYVDGVWVDKIAESYLDGAWVPWIMYYYKPGDTCDAVTGGFYAENPSTVFADDSIQMVCGAQQYWCIRTNNKVDLTNIKDLYLNMENLRTNASGTVVYFAVTDAITTDYTYGFDKSVRYDAGENENGTNPALTLDVRSVTGSKYIYVFLRNSYKYTESRVNVKEIRGE